MISPRVLVVGRSGQVAQALANAGQRHAANVTCRGRPTVDLSNRSSMVALLQDNTPDIVLNAAAYTSVDGAESAPEESRLLNVDGPGWLAETCEAAGVPLIHLSTDCVFDGALERPYRPDDASNPIGVYGQTKWEGELCVREACPRSLIIRVSWIFSEFADNFVRTMLRLAATRDAVEVVNDQYGCPTYAPALADALLDIAAQVTDPGFDRWGVYHLAGKGETDRASMARTIFRESAAIGGPYATVCGVRSADYPTPATRPLNARLDMSQTEQVFGVELPDWREGLRRTVSKLNEGASA